MSQDLNTMLADALRNGISGITPPADISTTGASSPQGVSGVAPTDTVSQANETKNKVALALLGWEGQGAEVLNKDLLVLLYNEMTNRVVGHITSQMAKSSQEMREMLDEDVKAKIRSGLEQFFSQTTDLQINKGEALADKSVYATMSLSSVTSMIMMSAASLGDMQEIQLNGLHPSALSGIDQSIQPLLIASGAFLSVGLTAPVLKTLALGSQKDHKGLSEKQAGKAYGIQVARSVMAGYVENLLRSVFSAKPEAVTKELVDRVELSYLFGALAAVERAENGWVNLEEMVSLLTEGPVYQILKGADRGDPRVIIADLIQERLKGLDKKERALLVLSHLEHYKDSSDQDELEGQVDLINNFWKDFDYEQITENRA